MFGLDELVDVAMPLQSQGQLFNGTLPGVAKLPGGSFDWVAAMDSLRDSNGWTDADLCKRIKLSLSMIKHCRKGRRPVPPPARVRILAELGFEITRQQLLSVVQPDLRLAVLEADRSVEFVRTSLVDNFFDQIDPGERYAKFVPEFLRSLLSSSSLTEKEFIEHIRLVPNEFQAILAGETKLPFRAKLAIRELFGGGLLGGLILRLQGAA